MISPESIFKPFITSLARSEVKYICRGEINRDCEYTNGHFPNHPVLPAVALIDGSIEVLKKIKNTSSLKYKVKSAKFTHIVTPENPIEIQAIELSEKKWQVDWYLSGTPCASLEFEL